MKLSLRPSIAALLSLVALVLYIADMVTGNVTFHLLGKTALGLLWVNVLFLLAELAFDDEKRK